MKSFRYYLAVLIIGLSSLPVSGQVKEVSIVVSGSSRTKEQAINNALRSAIEQSFGTFVSASTEIINDELIKDDIATVSSGNIKAYKLLSESFLPNGFYSVFLNATVSVEKLTSYAKNHGSSCEFAGALFAQNVKLREFYKKNEQIALENLWKQVNAMAADMFDIEMAQKEEPFHVDAKINRYWNYDERKWEEEEEWEEGYIVPLSLTLKSNSVSDKVYKLICTTLSSLSMTEEEAKDYVSNNQMQAYGFTLSFQYFPENYSLGQKSVRIDKNDRLYYGDYYQDYKTFGFDYQNNQFYGSFQGSRLGVPNNYYSAKPIITPPEGYSVDLLLSSPYRNKRDNKITYPYEYVYQKFRNHLKPSDFMWAPLKHLRIVYKNNHSNYVSLKYGYYSLHNWELVMSNSRVHFPDVLYGDLKDSYDVLMENITKGKIYNFDRFQLKTDSKRKKNAPSSQIVLKIPMYIFVPSNEMGQVTGFEIVRE